MTTKIANLERALSDSIASHGDHSFEAARLREKLAEAYMRADRWTLANQTIERAIADLEPLAERGNALATYARLLEAQGRLVQAERIRTDSLIALERALGPGSLEVAGQLEKYARLLDRLGRPTESDRIRAKAAAIRETAAAS